MCYLCVEVAKGTMSEDQVARAFWESDIPEDHWAEAIATINQHYNGDEIGRILGEMYRKMRRFVR